MVLQQVPFTNQADMQEKYGSQDGNSIHSISFLCAKTHSD